MNKIVNQINNLKDKEYLVKKVGFDFKKSILHIEYLPCSLILVYVVSLMANMSFWVLAIITTIVYFLTTAMYTKIAPTIHLRRVKETDFLGVNLNNIERQIIKNAQDKYMSYGQLMKELGE